MWRRLYRELYIGILLLFSLTLVGLPVYAEGYQPLRVEPSRLIFEGKPGDQITGSIQVIHKGSEEASPRSVLSDWTLSADNELVGVDSGSLDSTLDGWIRFNPRVFTFEPEEVQVVRFTIRIPQDAQACEHRGLIGFEQIVPYEEEGAGASVSVQVATTIYVAVEPVSRTCEVMDAKVLTDLQNSSTAVRLSLKGTGSAHFRGTGEFQVFSVGEEEPLAQGVFEPIVVLPDVTTNFKGIYENVLPEGKYHIVVVISSDEPNTDPIRQIYEYTQPAL